MSRQPIIGVSACTKQIGHNIYHTAGDKYLQAIVQVVGGMPVIIPALGEQLDQAYLLQHLDGLVFTGSPLATPANPAPPMTRRVTVQPFP